MIYNYSEEAIKNIKRRMLILVSMSWGFILFVFGLGLWHGVNLGPSPMVYISALAISFLIFGLIFYFMLGGMFRRFRGMKIELKNDSVTFFASDRSQTVSFSSITQFVRYTNPATLSFVADKKRYAIFGYEKMDEIADSFEKKLDPSAMKTIHRKINWDKPIPLILMGLLGLLLLAVVLVGAHFLGISKIIDKLFFIGYGIYLVFFAPETMPKYTKKLGWVLLVIGVLLVISLFTVNQ